ncbi:MAG: tetratricopeptide repeat protein, partial [candidate division KSB1 bacterium]|nr:tetratricopeptide repeat protein [candidate division KSB1 bacterium]
ASPHGLMGNNLFLEHLHPNLQGYFIIGREIAHAMQREGAIARVWENRSALSDSLLWQRRGVTPLDLEVATIRIQVLTSRWPFVPERSSADFRYQPQNEIQRLAYDLWRKHLSWEEAHVKAAEYYAKEGNLRLAAAEYDALILETPYNPSPYLRSGIVHIMLGEMETAEHRFKASLALNETAEAHENLGAVLLHQKKIVEAVAHLERALQMQPGNTQTLYNLTGGYMMLGQADKAEQTLHRLENLQPGSLEVAGLKSDLVNLRRLLEKRP